jgi:hypothetical protein
VLLDRLGADGAIASTIASSHEKYSVSSLL